MSDAMWAKYEKMRDEAITAARRDGVREGLERAQLAVANYCNGRDKIDPRPLYGILSRLADEQKETHP